MVIAPNVMAFRGVAFHTHHKSVSQPKFVRPHHPNADLNAVKVAFTIIKFHEIGKEISKSSSTVISSSERVSRKVNPVSRDEKLLPDFGNAFLNPAEIAFILDHCRRGHECETSPKQLSLVIHHVVTKRGKTMNVPNITLVRRTSAWRTFRG